MEGIVIAAALNAVSLAVGVSIGHTARRRNLLAVSILGAVLAFMFCVQVQSIFRW